jgi:lipid-A-disaccharide synthase
MNVFFSVGEPSGDLHGANLITELSRRCDRFQAFGFGGPRMLKAGQNQTADLTQMAIMFIADAVKNIRTFWGLYQRARKMFSQQKFDAVVLIDYPGFNWWIAKAAKQAKIPVYYYGVPQMWAWAPWRIAKLRRRVDHVLCKLPFEPDWFQQRGVRAEFVGHPYYDELACRQLDSAFVAQMRSTPKRVITFLPGSRDREVRTNLPMMLNTAKHLFSQREDIKVVVAAYKESQAEFVRDQVRQRGLPVEVYSGKTPELIEAAHGCLACSGSVSLELLYHLKPSIIQYVISPFQNFLQRRIVNSRFITLVNLFAVDDIQRRGHPAYEPDAPDAEPIPFPEYLTVQDRSLDMARRIHRWLDHPSDYESQVDLLRKLKDRSAQAGASRRAADYLIKTLNHPTVELSMRAA